MRIFFNSQEGWRLEHENPQDNSTPLMFKGVVYNEMKGVFVSLFLLLSSHPVFVDLFVLFKKNIREKQWAIKNGQSLDTGNIGHRKQNDDKQNKKHNIENKKKMNPYAHDG